jgi:hypothetical protein
MRVLVHDGIGVWPATRRRDAAKFVCPAGGGAALELRNAQLEVLVLKAWLTRRPASR